MDQLNRLRKVTLQAQMENELPDELAARLFVIADRVDLDPALAAEIDTLIALVAEYDTFAQTGYMGMGVDHVVLTNVLDRLDARLDRN
ncbi:MAG: hypothetical protein RQ723_03930 [Desulfuromonadales bacterium]|nr:hypothetical protein [Desulfuromonadales bacterium]